MLRKSPKWLEDIRNSCEFILSAVKNKRLEDYSAEPMLRAAVERHFEIIGEAVGRLARHDPETATGIGNHPQIISFRNVLIHGYDLIDHKQVWNVIHEHLPTLMAQVENLLREAQERQ